MTIPQKKSNEKPQLNLKTVTWGNLTWVDIVQPTNEAMKYLADQYNFNPLDLEDALSTRQVPKIEDYPQYLFAVFHISVYDKETRVSSRRQWSAFVGEKFLVTLRPPEMKAAEEVFRECELSEESREQYMGQGSGYLLYSIIDRGIDSYFRVLDKILNWMEAIEDNVFKEEVESGLAVSILRRDIITQRRIMFPTRPLLIELEKKLKRFAKADLTLFFSDLMDHLNKILDTLDEYAEVIDVFKDADYLLSGYRANRTVRTLALIFGIALPILVVSAIYVILPSSIDKSSVTPFTAMLALDLIVIVVTLYSFRRRHLI